MYGIEDFKADIEQFHMEISFTYADQHYFISDCFSPGILICGPQNDEHVTTTDEVLDKLLVDGKPMRTMMDVISPD